MKSLLIWILAFVITVAAAAYQRLTGPTYPVKGKLEIAGEKVKYHLPRSGETDASAEVWLSNLPEGATAELTFKRFKVEEPYTTVEFVKSDDKDDKFVGYLPAQPAAGKLEYFVVINQGDEVIHLNSDPVVIRFKGVVPLYILIPHILFMFLAMLLGTRAGLEALFHRPRTVHFALATLIGFFIGGLILGPIVQKFAFDAYWTGWPFGGDLTDNKTLVVFLAWIVAWIRLRRNPGNRVWPLIAVAVMFLVYLIPHSMFGSELDYSTGVVNTGNNG
ncbi:MAG: hypothetical protein Kow00127_12110 [Bacteroidales bacterium]